MFQNPVAPPTRHALSGRFVTLLPLDPARDAAGLYAISHGTELRERLWTYLPYGPFADQTALRDWLDVQAQSLDPLFFTVMDNARQQPLGMVSFLSIVPAMRRLELGHLWYGPDAQRTRANTESIYLMLRESFALGYRRVEWKCNALNDRSRAAALRLGFRYEGLFRQHMIVKGQNRDTAWFAMLDHEWPAVQTNMERWLYANEAGLSLTQLNAALSGLAE